jgi:riboflavin kinase/FMN adenylyltransferase
MRRKRPIVLTIGVFDGVHRGHQALLRRTVALARELRAEPSALTFRDHPMHVLRKGPRIPFLLDRRETFELLERNGIQNLRVLDFTKAFSRKSPGEFVRWLGRLGFLRAVVVGRNFRFGKGAMGDIRVLGDLGRRSGFRAVPVPSVRVRGRVVSSSAIRGLLVRGRIRDANLMLGRPYVLEGTVEHGKHEGHKVGFPTANLGRIPQFLPKDGVYACAVRLGGRNWRGGMNLGKRPTFRDDDHHRAAEIHLLGFQGRLYGRRLKVHLLDYLRPERKFRSPKALAAQIRSDLLRIRKTKIGRLESP